MASTLLFELERLVTELDALQQEMSEALDSQQSALEAGETSRLEELSAREGNLTSRFQRFYQARHGLLERARREGNAASSLGVLAERLGAPAREVFSHLQKAQGRADKLRRQSQLQWLVAHRLACHTQGLVEIIARKAPHWTKLSHNSQAEPVVPTGLSLDASV